VDDHERHCIQAQLLQQQQRRVYTNQNSTAAAATAAAAAASKPSCIMMLQGKHVALAEGYEQLHFAAAWQRMPPQLAHCDPRLSKDTYLNKKVKF
jgi:hypothetical protein